MKIGKSIRKIRRLKGINQQDLAHKAEISISYLNLIENGKRSPKFETVEKICIELNTPLVFMVFLSSSKEEKNLCGSEMFINFSKWMVGNETN